MKNTDKDAEHELHEAMQSVSESCEQRRVTNAFQALLLFILVTSALPTFHPAQDALRETLDPIVDALGLWQSQWELFAPEPDKINVRVSAVVQFEDGVTAAWKSPDWQNMSPAARFRQFRYAEFVDGIRRDTNRGAWPAFARWIAFAVPHPEGGEAAPAHVTLWRHWVVIPKPQTPLPPLSHPLPMRHRAKFHEQRLAP